MELSACFGQRLDRGLHTRQYRWNLREVELRVVGVRFRRRTGQGSRALKIWDTKRAHDFLNFA